MILPTHAETLSSYDVSATADATLPSGRTLTFIFTLPKLFESCSQFWIRDLAALIVDEMPARSSDTPVLFTVVRLGGGVGAGGGAGGAAPTSSGSSGTGGAGGGGAGGCGGTMVWVAPGWTMI